MHPYVRQRWWEQRNAPDRKQNDESSVSFILESLYIYGMNGTLARKNMHFDITTYAL